MISNISLRRGDRRPTSGPLSHRYLRPFSRINSAGEKASDLPRVSRGDSPLAVGTEESRRAKIASETGRIADRRAPDGDRERETTRDPVSLNRGRSLRRESLDPDGDSG